MSLCSCSRVYSVLRLLSLPLSDTGLTSDLTIANVSTDITAHATPRSWKMACFGSSGAIPKNPVKKKEGGDEKEEEEEKKRDRLHKKEVRDTKVVAEYQC